MVLCDLNISYGIVETAIAIANQKQQQSDNGDQLFVSLLVNPRTFEEGQTILPGFLAVFY
ncbi:hypothetical protein Taro_025598 [Colocasia esculenta]|uniref:Uncharacterized protein n=1 Tax=Colocasia esculenta TaxID=4460 RepID=A0A843VI35_COLES|nr:hypothetical protein [Colocasia esculenta]